MTDNHMKRVRQRLKDQDYRLTPQREAILDILLGNRDKHLSADDIYLKLQRRHPEIGLATVYRTLDVLADLGLVYKSDFGSGKAVYELIEEADAHCHHHLICLSCGKVLEFDEDLLEPLEEAVASESRFRIVDHSLRFFGFCQDCQARDGQES